MTVSNRLTALMESDRRDLLSVFLTAGYPELGDAPAICETLSASGVDLIELGFPFSDSLVDGPTIQQANEVALANGMTLDLYFEQVKEIRERTEIPLIFMCCVNPLLRFGIEKFVKCCADSGIDGLILPDLPAEEYNERYRELFESHGLSVVLLVTARTPDERIRFYDELSSGFLYAVSSESTTGNTLEAGEQLKEFLGKLEKMELKNSVLIGFGISDAKSFAAACELSRGAIIGSAFLRALGSPGELKNRVKSFVEKLRN